MVSNELFSITDRCDALVRFLYERGRHALDRLLEIPGAATSRVAQAIDDCSQTSQRVEARVVGLAARAGPAAAQEAKGRQGANATLNAMFL